MKTVCTLFLGILVSFIFLCSNTSFSQKNLQNLKSGIKETECSYAQQYTKPTTISFAFAGDPDYVNYYFRDLKEHLFKEFSKKGIVVNFSNVATEDPTFFLKVDDYKVLHENNGYDREVRYTLNGILTKKDTPEPSLSFTITVNAIHDINQQNKKVVAYLLGKIEGLKD
jgi:hypothetical protein